MARASPAVAPADTGSAARSNSQSAAGLFSSPCLRPGRSPRSSCSVDQLPNNSPPRPAMKLPFSPEMTMWLALPLGLIFGLLLHRGGVADYNKIVNQFRFRDFTVLKIMFTAIVVGGIGVLILRSTGHAQFHIKPANM